MIAGTPDQSRGNPNEVATYRVDAPHLGNGCHDRGRHSARTVRGGCDTYRSIQVAGAVHCINGSQNVEGVWVNSSAGGSKWATWIWSGYTGSANTYAAYTATLSVPWPSSSSSTSIQIRVGCGGTKQTWGSTNRTPSVNTTSSRLLSANCANPSTATHHDATTCSIASNGSDSGAITAARWALAHINAVSSGSYTTDHYWAGWCTTFVYDAWAGHRVYRTATDMYSGFKHSGRVPSFSQVPPVGALAFYRLAPVYDPKGEGHVNIHVGLGVFVSTKGNVGGTHYPIVAYRVSQYVNSTHTYLGSMMPPTGWRGR